MSSQPLTEKQQQQILKFATVMATGKETSSTTGITSSLTGGFGKKSRWDVFVRFLQGKASPIPGLFLATLQGHDFTGAPVSWSSLPTYERAAGQSLVPFVAQDIWNVWHASGMDMAFETTIPALIGFGVTAYKPKAPGGSSPAGGSGWGTGTGSGGSSGWGTPSSKSNSGW